MRFPVLGERVAEHVLPLASPFRKQVAESGMTDEELDGFFQIEFEAYRRVKKAKPA